jgi:hypothetical protein
MRKSSDGRNTVFPWSNAPADVSRQDACPYAVGDTVFNSYVPPSRGTVVSVDAGAGTVSLDWHEGYGAIVYPMDAAYLRKAMPWE